MLPAQAHAPSKSFRQISMGCSFSSKVHFKHLTAVSINDNTSPYYFNILHHRQLVVNYLYWRQKVAVNYVMLAVSEIFAKGEEDLKIKPHFKSN